jgi:hypothetical protein
MEHGRGLRAFYCWEGSVRYIGQTRRPVAKRFEEHERQLRRRFLTEWEDGFPVEYTVLQTCDDELLSEAEIHAMGYFKGLWNERISGQTWFNAVASRNHATRWRIFETTFNGSIVPAPERE